MRIGALRHQVVVENPGVEVPDGDGNYTTVPAVASPSPVWAEIKPATARDLERVVAGTVQSTASHIVRMRFHPSITTKTRLLYGTRVFAVTGVQNEDERNVQLTLTCQEVVI